MNHTFDDLGRLIGVDTKLPTPQSPSPSWQTVISGVQFNAFGAVTSLSHLGNVETRQYNVLGQMTRLSKSGLIDMEYRFSATANDGKIVSQKNWISGEDVVFQYDELERLISASTVAGTSWGLSWSYDGFGNRLSQTLTQGTGPSSVVLVDGSTNRISSSGYSYDLNGNMTMMPKGSGAMTMSYDLSNRLVSVVGTDFSEQYVYAPDNRRVWTSNGRFIFYAPNGKKMGVYVGDFSQNITTNMEGAVEENVYYGSRLVAKWTLWSPSALVSDFTADRLQSKGNGSGYFPYGESKTGAAGTDQEEFATYTRSAASGLDYADQRWYASGVGRFTTVDPLWSGKAHNSRTSQYVYSDDDPINFLDPNGLDSCSVSGDSIVCSFNVTKQLRVLGLEGIGGGTAHNNISPGALEQDIPWANQAYGGIIPDDKSVAESLKDLAAKGSLTDCEALALYVGEVNYRDIVTGTNAGARAINDAMKQITPSTLAGSFASAVFSNFGHSSDATRFGDNGRVSGYRVSYQQGNEDQGHHFAFYFQLGFGLEPTTISNVLQNVLLMKTLPVLGEFVQGTPGNTADASLGTVAMAIGAGVRNGTISAHQAAARILKDVCK